MRSAVAHPPAGGGFTLLEVMVAVTILGIVLLTVYGTLTRAIYAKEYAEERAQLAAVGREAVLRIADELEGALSPAYLHEAVFQGVSAGTGQFADQLRFVITSRPPFGPLGGSGGRVVVTYSLDAQESSDKVFLLRRDEVPLTLLQNPEDTETEEEQPQPLALLVTDQVAGLRFRYLDGGSRQWVEDWDSTTEEFLDRIPMAVEVALYLYDGDGNIRDYATIADLPLSNFGEPTPTPGGP